MRRVLLLALTLFSVFQAFGQEYLLSGKVTDQANKPIGFTSVYIRNTTYGTTANENGIYQFKLKPGHYFVVYRFVGFKEKVQDVTITDHDETLNVQLIDEVYTLKDVYIKAKGRKRLNEDPAMEIMRQAIRKREFYLNEVQGYNCAIYIKGVQKLTSAPKSLVGRNVAQVLDLDSNGRGVLYQSESLSKFSFKQPDKVKEVMLSSKVAGQTTAFSYNKASDLQVNFYKNLFEINGLSNRGFVSPVADDAMGHYRYKLLGSAVGNGITVHKIEVIPRRQNDQVFRGNIYIVDGQWRIYSVDLLLTKQANINLLDSLSISQQYIPIKDNIWQPASIQYTFKGDVLGFKFEGYYAGVYNNYEINPAFPEGYFTGEVMRIDTGVNRRDSAYWAKIRPIPLTAQEVKDYHKKDSVQALRESKAYIDSVDSEKNKFSPLGYAISGYNNIDRYTGRSIRFFPLYETLFFNTVEGWGLNLKAAYTQTFKNRQSYTIVPNVRYGFGNKMLNANLSGTYLYDPSHQGYFFGRFGTDVLDLSNVGTRSLIFNTMSSLLSERNHVKLYRSKHGLLAWQREVGLGKLLNVQLSYAERDQLYNTSFNHIKNFKDRMYTSNNPLDNPDPVDPFKNAVNPPDMESQLFPKNQALTFKTSLTFTFDQRYTTRPDGRYYEPSKYPKLRINYRKGIKGILGSDVDYDFASADIFDDHLSTGLMGFSAFRISAGTFLNNKVVYFPDYNHFLGNQGMVFNPVIGNFHYLAFYTNSTKDSYVEAHYEHNFSGSLFNGIGFLRKLKLEEIAGANYLSNNNYSEFYIGLQRLIFRVDYGIALQGNNKVTQGFRIFYGIR
jgi:hypothetical protein